MHRKIINKFKNKFKLNHNNYSYFIGDGDVVIKFPDGKSHSVDKKAIKGYSNENFQKVLDSGASWSLTEREIEKYVREKLWN